VDANNSNVRSPQPGEATIQGGTIPGLAQIKRFLFIDRWEESGLEMQAAQSTGTFNSNGVGLLELARILTRLFQVRVLLVQESTTTDCKQTHPNYFPPRDVFCFSLYRQKY